MDGHGTNEVELKQIMVILALLLLLLLLLWVAGRIQYKRCKNLLESTGNNIDGGLTGFQVLELHGDNYSLTVLDIENVIILKHKPLSVCHEDFESGRSRAVKKLSETFEKIFCGNSSLVPSQDARGIIGSLSKGVTCRVGGVAICQPMMGDMCRAIVGPRSDYDDVWDMLTSKKLFSLEGPGATVVSVSPPNNKNSNLLTITKSQNRGRKQGLLLNGNTALIAKASLSCLHGLKGATIANGLHSACTRGAAHLQELDLSSNHLLGKIPEELQNLKLLLKLILSGNQLYGEIPSGIGMLADLEQLHLVVNNLSGPVPKEVGECLKLWQLNLENNKLEGNVPFKIANMNYLQILDLSSNLLTGEIPSQLGQMKHLETLNLSHNYLFGSIPSSFNEMSSLMLVDMCYNQLEGLIPDSKAFREASFDAFKNNRALCGNASGLKSCRIWECLQVKLSSGQVVAVKKLHTSVDGGMSHVKALTRESLGDVLRNEENARAFEWSKRVNVVKDFGMARIVKTESSNWSSFAGTFGYTALDKAFLDGTTSSAREGPQGGFITSTYMLYDSSLDQDKSNKLFGYTTN
ncbi:uncharacterized protein LOC132803773 [Ziziphus jujuba]|uniref:Uncharacterized protein LOC132803773 n=1 Tax=Ziziphus jujuba TaxID=326968 RepID=A0ABM4A963_ZIZJJ|nr:uncharacterized protein LOC132803773 [Ziziphus jujuba]